MNDISISSSDIEAMQNYCTKDTSIFAFDKINASDIVGAAMLCCTYNFYGTANRINSVIVWDAYGNLFDLRTTIYYKIDTMYLHETEYPSSCSIFHTLSSGWISSSEYNNMLNRIEDIYGMSIDEFSLGLLSYE